MKISSNRHLIHKTEIKFDRTVAAPKNTSQSKTQSFTNITSKTSIVKSPFSLMIVLQLQNKKYLNFPFTYNQETKVSELLLFIKQKINTEDIYFTSDNILIDYFLTIGTRCVIELTYTKLYLKVNRILVSDKLTLKEIHVLKCIGIGGFSKVVLAEVYGIIMAIKIINKEFIVKSSKQALVENQKNILLMCQGHPFITKLYFSFETNRYIIFGLEYCTGGELFNLLKKIKKMKEIDAKFYFLEILMAIQHLHSQGILYRDLKPQNILIDADGHLRLADFGLSKIINRAITYSFCGSAEYISPQMLLKKGHSYQVDYYCLGALVYQLVTGLPPFYTHNQTELFNNILYNELTFPVHANISEQLKAFLRKMLQKEPKHRFQNIEEILNNSWVMDNFNREAVLGKKLIPPFVTEIFKYNFDDSDFCLNQTNMLREIEQQTQFNKIPLYHFTNFYYQSKQIQQIKMHCFSNNKQNNKSNSSYRSFLKNNYKYKDELSYQSLTRQTHSLEQCKSIQYHSHKNIQNISISPKVGKPTPWLSQHKKTKTATPQHFPSNHSLPKPPPDKTLTIYTNKPRYLACTSPKHCKPQHSPFIKTLEQRYCAKISSPHSLEKNKFDFNKDKLNSLDKSYPNIKKPPVSSGTINYLIAHQDKFPNPKVKKSHRNIEKVNFHYNSSKPI